MQSSDDTDFDEHFSDLNNLVFPGSVTITVCGVEEAGRIGSHFTRYIGTDGTTTGVVRRLRWVFRDILKMMSRYNQMLFSGRRERFMLFAAGVDPGTVDSMWSTGTLATEAWNAVEAANRMYHLSVSSISQASIS